MKKTMKRLAAILLASVLSLSLCSCNFLDELRANRAVFADEVQSAIEWNGQTYKRYRGKGPAFAISMYQQINVTTPDVPVLLAGMGGKTAGVSKDRSILNLNDYNWSWTGESNYYLLESRYDELSKLLSTTELDYCCFETHEYAMDTYGLLTTLRLFTDKETAAFKALLEDQKNPLSQKDFDRMFSSPYYCKTISIMRCDSTATFTEPFGEVTVFLDPEDDTLAKVIKAYYTDHSRIDPETGESYYYDLEPMIPELESFLRGEGVTMVTE